MKTLLRIGAHFPARLKCRLTERVFRRLSAADSNLEVETNLGLRGNLKWRVPARRANLAFGLPANDVGERATFDLVIALSVMADGFLDVGANYGLFSAGVRLSNQRRSYAVVSLEADPDLAARLDDNAKRNDLDIRVLPMAASNTVGPSTFRKNLTDDSSGSLTTHFSQIHDTREIQINCVLLSSVINEYRLQKALVKVDVEGAGALAWEGPAPASKRVDYLIMEVIGPEAEARLPEGITDQTGWRSYYIEDYVLRETKWRNFEYVPPYWNWLFCRDGPEELRRVLPARFEIIALPGTGSDAGGTA